MAVQAAVITAVLLFLALYRFYRLKESKVCVSSLRNMCVQQQQFWKGLQGGQDRQGEVIVALL
jgi:hypothetical protein